LLRFRTEDPGKRCGSLTVPTWKATPGVEVPHGRKNKCDRPIQQVITPPFAQFSSKLRRVSRWAIRTPNVPAPPAAVLVGNGWRPLTEQDGLERSREGRAGDRLHELVCEGDVDLISAQREISSDWIAAYCAR
jgi:hypothetical protein